MTPAGGCCDICETSAILYHIGGLYVCSDCAKELRENEDDVFDEYIEDEELWNRKQDAALSKFMQRR